MIEVKNLTKRFGDVTAVDSVSFSVPRGQVVGFLGPNGAGKTTTMRLLTGYLPPDDGEASLVGYNLSENSLEIRRRIGYLPENNPLPEDLEVTEFLHFIGILRGLHDPDDRMRKVKRVLKTCSLGDVIGRKLGELSKGFRQRVGLAQAIIHDPEILILDEPTSGLDPNQVGEVRSLIQHLGTEKTLLISTHILSEVQSTCDRIIIINKGKIVADGTPDKIAGSLKNVSRLGVSFKAPKDAVLAELKNLSGVRGIEEDRGLESEGDLFILESDLELDLREDIFKLAVRQNWVILSLKQERLNLEDIFKALTKD